MTEIFLVHDPVCDIRFARLPDQPNMLAPVDLPPLTHRCGPESGREAIMRRAESVLPLPVDPTPHPTLFGYGR